MSIPERQLTFGEYMRRLRRDRKMSLQELAATTGLSYSHLSRIENDSTVPAAETVSKIAAVVDGDLRQMLELAECLPRAILDRITSLDTVTSQAPLVFRGVRDDSADESRLRTLVRIALDLGVPTHESQGLCEAVLELFRLPVQQRRAVTALIASLGSDDGGSDR
jgi:transcriptional regulator with XRE-family HTH domain